ANSPYIKNELEIQSEVQSEENNILKATGNVVAIFKGNSLSAYSPYTDGGFLIHTPIGLYFGSVFTSLIYEVSNYSFTSSSFDNE
mgnify:CR=1